MRPDIPFWTWVLARRIPIFALIVTVIMALGASLISRHTQNYFSTSELVIDPVVIQNRSIDSQTHFEFLKFRALTSVAIDTAISELSLSGDPIGRINVNHSDASGKISLGYFDPDPETALLMTRAVTQIFLTTAKLLEHQDAQHRIDFHTSEVQALRDDLDRNLTLANETGQSSETRVTEGLFQTALDNLSKAKADLNMPASEVLTVLREPTLAKSPSGPTKTSMYLALVSFAVFCGLIAVLILEWIDTVIRRPHDIDATLGLATFGVIPDLQMQPILNSSNSKRGT